MNFKLNLSEMSLYPSLVLHIVLAIATQYMTSVTSVSVSVREDAPALDVALDNGASLLS